MDQEPGGWREAGLLGFSSWSAHRILNSALAGTPVRSVPGDFVAYGERATPQPEQVLVSSVVAALPYFYTVTGDGRFLHGRDVFELGRRACLPWRWNEDALRSLAWLGHTVDRDTLHRDVHRVPPCAVLRYAGGELTVHRQEGLRAALQGPRGGVIQAIAAFKAALQELAGDRPLVSLSAGFDSRAILAGVLELGIRPVLATAGSPEGTDRVVASRIARALELEHRTVEIAPRAYLEHGSEISHLTGGTKPARHWHSYLYPLELSAVPAAPHLIGSNGEFARSFYLDRGALARTTEALPLDVTVAQFAARVERWHARYACPLDLLGDAGPAARLAFARRLASLCAGPSSLLDRLDLFYAEQRVRHFIGNGLALMGASTRAVAPFLDARWVDAAARLPRQAKLGSRFHRTLIAECDPRLLEHPLAGERRVLPAPRLLYWLRKPASVGYDSFAAATRLREFEELIRDSPLLDQFATPKQRLTVLAAHDEASLDLLLTLHFAAQAAA